MRAFLTGQSYGWMTKKIWDIFNLTFIIEIQRYRSSLDAITAAQHNIVFGDNHISRVSYFTCKLLSLFRIELLTFPAYCTVVLQLFDVGCAASLRSKNNRLKYVPLYTYEQDNLSNIPKPRLKIVRILIDACD